MVMTEITLTLTGAIEMQIVNIDLRGMLKKPVWAGGRDLLLSDLGWVDGIWNT